MKKQLSLAETTRGACLVISVVWKLLIFLSVFRHDHRGLLCGLVHPVTERPCLADVGVLWDCFRAAGGGHRITTRPRPALAPTWPALLFSRDSKQAYTQAGRLGSPGDHSKMFGEAVSSAMYLGSLSKGAEGPCLSPAPAASSPHPQSTPLTSQGGRYD